MRGNRFLGAFSDRRKLKKLKMVLEAAPANSCGLLYGQIGQFLSFILGRAIKRSLASRTVEASWFYTGVFVSIGIKQRGLIQESVLIVLRSYLTDETIG
jgi:hypothetical protein